MSAIRVTSLRTVALNAIHAINRMITIKKPWDQIVTSAITQIAGRYGYSTTISRRILNWMARIRIYNVPHVTHNKRILALLAHQPVPPAITAMTNTVVASEKIVSNVTTQRTFQI